MKGNPFIESGNYRIGVLMKKSNTENIVRCNIDNLLLLVTNSKIPLEKIPEGSTVQVFRTTTNGCFLIDYKKEAQD